MSRANTSEPALPIDLSIPDNSELVRGRHWGVETLWFFVGLPLIRSKLIPFSLIRVLVLKAFGARVGTGVYTKPGLHVKFPWYLSIGDFCWIGENAWIDNLAQVTIEPHVCVSQGAYLCTGNHDWSSKNMKLFRRPIRLRYGCWVGAKSVVCPGVTMHEGSILIAGSVASRDVPAFEIHGGNPAMYMRKRVMKDFAHIVQCALD